MVVFGKDTAESKDTALVFIGLGLQVELSEWDRGRDKGER